MESERLAPHNIEAEEAVLGSCLVDPDALLEVAAIITPGDFYREKNQWVFEAMVKLGAGLDQITVGDELQKKGRLEDIGGLAYLSHLVLVLPTSVHARHYASVVVHLSFCRKVIIAGAQIAAVAYEAMGDSVELFAKAQDILSTLEPRDSNEIVFPGEHAGRMLDMVTKAREYRSDGLNFGYRDLDRFVGALYPGNLVIIGARPGMGKSQMLQEIALHNAGTGKRVLVASREISLEEFDERYIQMETGVGIEKLREGCLNEVEWGLIQELVDQVNGTPLIFLEGSFGVDSIAQKAKLLRKTQGLDLLLVDYIQLLKERTEKKAGDNLRERIGYISNSLKSIARELEIPVIAVSQLNRNVEGRENKRPTLADLKESGDLEQDADVVLLLHRPEVYDSKAEPGVMHVGVAKHRQLGKIGRIRLSWRPEYHRYGDWSDDY